jgi:hypothetical protein
MISMNFRSSLKSSFCIPELYSKWGSLFYESNEFMSYESMSHESVQKQFLIVYSTISNQNVFKFQNLHN